MSSDDIIKFEKRFPSFEKTKEFINTLKATDLEKTSFEDIDKMINKYFELIPFVSGTISKGNILYRARLNENEKSFENISKLGLIPKEKVKEFGRANLPNESVFYSSDNFGMACGEVFQNIKYSYNPRKEMGVTTIGEWEVLRDLNISHVYYSESVMKKREDIKFLKNYYSSLIRAKSLINTETINASDLILAFFCDEFSKNNILTTNDYKFSVWYVLRLKRMNQLIVQNSMGNTYDGIVYPSVAMKYRGDNVALLDDDLDAKIKFKTAYELICTDFDYENSAFKFTKIGEIDSFEKNGKLNWK